MVFRSILTNFHPTIMSPLIFDSSGELSVHHTMSLMFVVSGHITKSAVELRSRFPPATRRFSAHKHKTTNSQLIKNCPKKSCIFSQTDFSKYHSWLAYICASYFFADSDRASGIIQSSAFRYPFWFLFFAFTFHHPCTNFILSCACFLHTEKYTLLLLLRCISDSDERISHQS